MTTSHSKALEAQLAAELAQHKDASRRVKTTVTRRKYPVVDWAAVDWTKSNRALARELKKTGSCIASHRPAGTGTHRPAMVKFTGDVSQVNWRKSDEYIARRLGISRTTVARLRREHAGGVISDELARRTRPVDWSDVDWLLSDKEIALLKSVAWTRVRSSRVTMSRKGSP